MQVAVKETEEYAPDVVLAQVSAQSSVEIEKDDTQLTQTDAKPSGNHLTLNS